MGSSTELYDSYLVDASKFSDLSGKVVAITGTTEGGIGFYIAKAAVKKNAACVLLLNRKSDRAAKAEEAIKAFGLKAGTDTTVKSIHIDLLSFATVEKAAEEVNEIAKEKGGLDVLCCNAGIMAMADDRTGDGFNIEIQACHLSHALLTKKCLGSLEQAAASRGEARVVYQSSSARAMGAKVEGKYFEKCEPMTLGGEGGAWGRYNQTKLANSAFAMALCDTLAERKSKVKSIACEPGYATSNLQTTSQNTAGGMMVFLNCAACFGAGQSPADGSLPASVASFGPDVDSGDFFLPSGRGNLGGPPAKSISKGMAVVNGKEPETTNKVSQIAIMNATLKAFGWSSFFD